MTAETEKEGFRIESILDRKRFNNNGKLGVHVQSHPSKQPQLKCPECGSTRTWKNGLRYIKSGETVQRYSCRDCGYRFSLPKASAKSELFKCSSPRTKQLNNLRLSKSNCQVCEFLTEGSKNLAEVRPLKEKLAGSTEKTNLKGELVNFAWQMKKQGYKTTTIRSYADTLKSLIKRNADLSNPESGKEVLAETSWSNTHKHVAIASYTLYLGLQGKTWLPPICKVSRKIPFIPTEQELDSLIAGCGKKTSTFLQLLKETALRSAEACNLQWRDVDVQRKIVTFNEPLKNGNPRVFRMSNKLIAMLEALPKKNSYVFATNNKVTRQTVFYKAKRRLAAKLNNPRLLRIGFHTFRHWKATMLYHQTKDPLLVKEFLGHKSLDTTLLYIQLEKALFNETADEFTVKASRDLKEIQDLLEVGFEYVCEKEGLIFFRKRK